MQFVQETKLIEHKGCCPYRTRTELLIIMTYLNLKNGEMAF